jgi:exodeoxyribonuclease VII large subunit
MKPTRRWPILPPMARATPTAAAEMAVPVREELRAFVGDLGLRSRRAVVRPVVLGRERLEARAQRLPTPEELIAAKAQALDETSERLRRALGNVAQRAGMRLQRAAGPLTPGLLQSRLRHAEARLSAQRLNPALLAQRLRHDRQRLDGVTRIMASLNPDNAGARLCPGDGIGWAHADQSRGGHGRIQPDAAFP